jgi:hypothetical protein
VRGGVAVPQVVRSGPTSFLLEAFDNQDGKLTISNLEWFDPDKFYEIRGERSSAGGFASRGDERYYNYDKKNLKNRLIDTPKVTTRLNRLITKVKDKDGKDIDVVISLEFGGDGRVGEKAVETTNWDRSVDGALEPIFAPLKAGALVVTGPLAVARAAYKAAVRKFGISIDGGKTFTSQANNIPDEYAEKIALIMGYIIEAWYKFTEEIKGTFDASYNPATVKAAMQKQFGTLLTNKNYQDHIANVFSSLGK